MSEQGLMDSKSKIKKRCEVHANKVLWAIQCLERDMLNLMNHGNEELMGFALKELAVFIEKHDLYRQTLSRVQSDMESKIDSVSNNLDI